MQNLYFGVHFLFQPLSAAAQSPKYLTVYVVLDKALVSPCQPLFPLKLFPCLMWLHVMWH